MRMPYSVTSWRMRSSDFLRASAAGGVAVAGQAQRFLHALDGLLLELRDRPAGSAA